MVATVLKLVGFDLQRQLARLKAEAEDFKDRTTDEIKHKAVNAGLAIAFAVAGLVFVVLMVIAGLIALYLWVEMTRGTFAALGAVGLTSAILAALMFIMAGMWGKKHKPAKRSALPPVVDYPATESTRASSSRVTLPPDSNPAAAYASGPATPNASLVDTITKDLTDRTVAAANEAIDAAAGIVRKSPPEAILAAMAVAVVAGIFVGRRRGASS